MKQYRSKNGRGPLRSVRCMLLILLCLTLLRLPVIADETTAPSSEAQESSSEEGSGEALSTEPSSEPDSSTEPSSEPDSSTEPSSEPDTSTEPAPPESDPVPPETDPEPPAGPKTWPADRDAFSIPYQGFPYDGITEDTNLIIATASANIRIGAGTEYAPMAVIHLGQTLPYTDTVQGSNGKTWYRVLVEWEGETYEGYISETMCRTAVLSAEGNLYDNFLRVMGFPDSYLPGLRALHEQYPNWVFLATQTGVKWGSALYEEANPPYYQGISLIGIDNISSWKSTENGTYDWTTSSWKTIYDGPKWTQASRELVAYALDPRNFFNDSDVFMFLNLLFDDTQTVEGLRRIVQGSFMEDGKHVYGESFSYPEEFYKIGKDLGINPYYLAATVRQEIGTPGNSKSINGRSSLYPGIYNYYNIYAFTMMGMDANDVGLWFASGEGKGYTTYERPWNSRLAALKGGAEYHAYNYLLNYQNTIYFKKWDVMPGSGRSLYRHQYMTNVLAAWSEGRNIARAYDSETRKEPLIFDIPVYLEMPDELCPKPTKQGSPNNRLKALTSADAAVMPAINLEDLEYDLVAGSATMTITAVPYDSTASVSGDGELSLEVGENIVKLLVTAQNGDEREYTLKILRLADDDPLLALELPKTVSGIEPGTTAADFLAAANISEEMQAKFTDADGKEKAADALVKTGDKIRVYAPNGLPFKESEILIYGDVNGDGKISLVDLITVRDHILGDYTLEGVYALAGNVSGDTKLSLVDLITIRDHILGDYVIPQKEETGEP